MRNAEPTLRIEVPGQRETLEPPSAARIRALKRHLIASFRDLLRIRRRERLIQKREAEPAGWHGAVVRAACAHCAGSCCMAGGNHAFLDERTLARVCAERPGSTVAALLGAYVAAVAPLSFRGSCLFHGPTGCTLERDLRAELCNAYYCNGLLEVLRQPARPGALVETVTHCGESRHDRL